MLLTARKDLLTSDQVFVQKMEAQLVDADGLPVRSRVNDIYERVINSVFGTLQQLAKMDRGDALAAEDKGQLNYHVIMIGECHRVGSSFVILALRQRFV